ncbi:MAG: 30S ribosome-binding factor RbfA [Anaerolineales bacterium]
MTISKSRAKKIGQRIQEDLAQLLLQEADDPRLTMVTVTGAEVDRELAFATIYVTAFDGDERKEEILEALRGAKGFLRSQLAANIELRVFPRLRFRWDSTAERAARIEDLLDQIHKDEERSEGEDG